MEREIHMTVNTCFLFHRKTYMAILHSSRSSAAAPGPRSCCHCRGPSQLAAVGTWQIRPPFGTAFCNTKSAISGNRSQRSLFDMGFMWDLPKKKWEVHGILSHLEDVCLWFQVAFNGLLIGFDQDHYENMEKLCENNGIIMNHDCWIVCQGSLEVKQYIQYILFVFLSRILGMIARGDLICLGIGLYAPKGGPPNNDSTCAWLY